MDLVLVSLKHKRLLIITFFVLVLILLGCFSYRYFLGINNDSIDAIDESIVEVDQEKVVYPLLSDEDKIELCSQKANSDNRSIYDFKWEIGATTNYSVNEESHQLKGYTYLDNEKAVLVQCNIESSRDREPDVRVSVLPEEYYTLEKFNIYLKHCEDLGGKLKGRGGYGHGMVGSCELNNGSICDLRDFYRGICK